MRTIKYKAYGKNSKEFLNEGKGITLKEISTLEDLDSWEFLEFTGLLDKNGKEIYEGDVVRLPIKDRCLSGCCKYDESSDTYTTTVKYHNASFYINSHGRNSDVEVIGNIH